MAEQTSVDLDDDVRIDPADHLATYRGFLKLLKYSTGAIIVVLILLAFFLL